MLLAGVQYRTKFQDCVPVSDRGTGSQVEKEVTKNLWQILPKMAGPDVGNGCGK